MTPRFALTTLAFFLAAALLVPAATAQSTPPKPQVFVTVKWEAEHEMVMDEGGRVDMGLIVDFVGVDFVCATAAKYKVEIGVDAFPKWAGASVVPKTVPTGTGHFEFPAGQPGAQKVAAQGSGNSEAKLNIAWDVETAPRENAMHEYKVRAAKVTLVEGTCSGSPAYDTPWSTPMVVRLPDRPDTANETVSAAVCDENPFAPGCPGSTPTALTDGGESPGPDVLIVLLGMVGLVGLWRRRQK